jgi:ferredoxin
MATVTVQGQTFECPTGANLRQVLLAHQADLAGDSPVNLYNGRAQWINCRGIGSCGTCAVAIEGEVAAANWRDRTRRSLPPHDPERPLRLACQTQVLGDITVTKYDGFWGQGDNQLW